MAAIYQVFFLVLVQLGLTVYSHGAYKICLSCSPVSHPRECTTFTQIWSDERCSTDRLLLLNGSTVFVFGFETSTYCQHSTETSAHGRNRRLANTDISLCHECCSESLCNRKLCGIPESNNTNLACLIGNEVGGLPTDTGITYCNAGEQCYAGLLQQHARARPNLLNYGCASQAACDYLVSGAGLSARCQQCCFDDGCNAHVCHSEFEQSQRTTASGMETTRGGFTEDGPYDIYPAPAYTRLRVRCDITTDGGGWTTLQRRYDGSLNFSRTLQQYQEGFGEVSSEHWLGLEWIHTLTTRAAEPVELRFDICSFNGSSGYSVYEGFSVAGQNHTYRLNPGKYMRGTISDWWTLHYNGLEFQTTGYCVNRRGGGWWYYGHCGAVFMNGAIYNGSRLDGIVWRHFGSLGYPSLRTSEMKIRPVNVTLNISRTYTCPP